MSDVLTDREQLGNKRIAYHQPGTVQVQVTLNIPGPVKRIPQAAVLVDLCQERLCLFLSSVGYHVRGVVREELQSGTAVFLAVDGDPVQVKGHCLVFEQREPLSPYWDIDVYAEGEPIRRQGVAAPPRRCFLCELPAKQCAFLQRHLVEELLAKLVADVEAFQRNGSKEREG